MTEQDARTTCRSVTASAACLRFLFVLTLTVFGGRLRYVKVIRGRPSNIVKIWPSVVKLKKKKMWLSLDELVK